MGDLLGEDFRLVQIETLYRCLDKALEHKQALFGFLQQRWQDLFNVDFDVLLYDLTSTYFEADPPGEGKRQFGYSRDKRSDCVQVVIALIITTEGFPLAYEVLPGNTSDKTTLSGFLKKIEQQYGPARRVWIMDRGIPTEATLTAMREATPPIAYLVGTPRGRLSQLEKAFLELPWEKGSGSGRRQATGAAGRTLHPGPQPGSKVERTLHSWPTLETTVEAAAPIATTKAAAGRAVAEIGSR